MWGLAGQVHGVLLAVCLIALLICAGPAFADTLGFSIRPEHPRLLVTSADLPRLRQQVAAYPDEWKRVQDTGLRPPSDPAYGDAFALRSAALTYLIGRDKRYLASSVALAENICRNHQLDRYASPEALFSLALAYDWCYPDLSDAQRGEIQQEILRLADYLRDSIWRHSDFNNHFVLEKVWPSVYTGLALHGDVADPRVDEYLRVGSDYLHNHLLPAANIMAGDSGGQFEGFDYDSWGYMRPMAWIFEAWRTATGEDLFTSCTATKDNALWNIYGLRPFDRRLEHFDDAALDHAWSGANEGAFIYLLARHYGDGHAQWMGDQIERRYDSCLWPIILWRDPDLLPQPPTDLPTARWFDSLGWVLMRSSWKEDATFASFQCGPFLTGHQHTDNNAFTIHKRALLAIDPGVNAYGENVKTDYRTNYYSRTIAHNSITVYDPKETFRGGAWALEDSGGANDGGQLRSSGLERVEETKQSGPWDRGKIVAYQHGPLFTYAVGDATKSYSPAKLGLFRRHFLFLPPDLFVIFDQVEATDPSFRKAWLLHCVDEPSVNGDIVTITNGPFGSAQGRPGRLTCRTVLPEHPEITKVGGPGKECWVDGRNWPAVEREWTRDAGSWRVEVSPPQPAAEDLFLHVLETDGDEIASPDAVSLTKDSGRVGVLIRAQGREYQVTFSTSAPCAHLRIAEHGNTVLEEDLE
jgi:hypothetical protein